MAGPEGGNDDGVGVSSIDNVAGFLPFLFISATTLENIYFYGFGTCPENGLWEKDVSRCHFLFQGFKGAILPAFKWQCYPPVVLIAWLNEEIPRLNAEQNYLLLRPNTATRQ